MRAGRFAYGCYRLTGSVLGVSQEGKTYRLSDTPVAGTGEFARSMCSSWAFDCPDEGVYAISGMFQFILSVLILGFGAVFAWFYLGASRSVRRGSRGTIGGGRPWRRLGAGIVVVVAVMFVVGLYWSDGSHSPRAFAAYWLIMLLMVGWLCVLAAKDVLYTRRMIAVSRDAKTDLDAAPDRDEEASAGGG